MRDATSEARKTPRLPAKGLRFESELAGEVFNISRLGLAMETRAPVVLGESYAFGISSESGSVELQGVVQWCSVQTHDKNDKEKNDPSPLYQVGFEFSNGPSWELEGLLSRRPSQDNRGSSSAPA